MNILFVSPDQNPFNGTGWGSVQRTNLLFEACTQLGHVDVVTFVNDVVSTKDDCDVLYAKYDDIKHRKDGRLSKILRMFVPWNPYAMFPKNPHRASIIRTIIKQNTYDFIICRYIPSAMECGLLDYASQLVIDIDDNPIDVERTAARTCRTVRNRLYHQYRSIVLGYVLRKIQNECLFTFHSVPTQIFNKNSAYLPNIPFYNYDMIAVDFSRTANRILFVGNMSYGPNLIGILHFIEYIFPLVREDVPDAELHLVGGCNDSSFLMKCRATEGVEYIGFVDDLKEEYNDARVVAVPIYGGAGTNIKVLEAMKMCRPCVTTSYGARGYSDYFHHQKEIVVTENDQQFAFAIVELLCNEAKNHDMSYRAQLAVTNHFSREMFNKIVKKNLQKC